MAEKDRFLELLVKKKLNNATLGDIAEFNLLCKDFEKEDINFDELDNLLHLKYTSTNLPTEKETLNNWEKFITKANYLEAKSDKKIINKRIKYIVTTIAATVLILLGFSTYFYLSIPHSSKLNIISTQNGSKSKVEMPDGTQIWLNGGSKITYDNEFGIKTRTVTLTGEAFFDVKHDAKHPFIIRTKNLELKVLGTAFNIRDYDKENESAATLIRGSLEVSFLNRPNERIILKPNQKVSYSHKTVTKSTKQLKINVSQTNPIISVSNIDFSPKTKAIEEIAWVDNKLIFRSKTFEELALDLELWYGVKINIEKDNIRGKKFTGVFKNETVFEALNALKQTYTFDYVFDKATNTITIN